MTGETLLLVDDDPAVTWSLGRCLTQARFTVTTCASAEEALSLLRVRPFEHVVTDIQLGGVSGLEIIRWLRQHRPAVRVVVITAFGSPTLRAVVESPPGTAHYLEKPVDPDQLVALLHGRHNEERLR